jgi:hypothetical protein
MRFPRLALLPVVALGFLFPAGLAAGEPPARPAPPPAAAEPACRPLTETEKRDLTLAFRAYLDVESEKAMANRMALMATLKGLRDGGCDPLRDIDGLGKVLYAARSYDAPLDRKSVGREVEFNVDAVTGVASLSGESMRFSFQLPTKYPKDVKALATLPPYPMIVTLHDLVDFQDRAVKKFPGAEVLKRRFPRATNKAIHDEFILFAPVATRAKFSQDGAIDADKVPLHEMWRRYHVDFDRIVIDGGADALLFAAAGVFYAGVIVRGDGVDVDPAIVRNFAHTKVYVVGTEASAAKKSLLAGKMPPANITVGNEEGIHAWVKGLDRKIPTSFEWVVKDKSAQRVAHWMNVNEVDPAVAMPTLKVEVVNTKDDPNTVKIESVGIRGLSLFLNDEVVCLEEPLRIVLNGRPVTDAQLVTGRPEGKAVKLPVKLDRNADVMFDASKELSIRRSRYYGFLFPVMLDFAVRSDAEKGEPGGAAPSPAAPASAATPQQEADAAQYFAKAEEREKAGDLEKAKSLLQRAIDVGPTSVKAKAEAKLKELSAKGDAEAAK